jgi:DNA-binding response OmpR family regulator
MQSEKRRILYIEDHEDTRELVTFVLEDRDFEVISDRTIAGALELATMQSFDLFLLDSWLPDGSGVELCRKLREFDVRTPVLFYSAAAYEIDKENAHQAGAQGYLIKPSRFSELSDLISNLIDAAKANGLNCSQNSERLASSTAGQPSVLK